MSPITPRFDADWLAGEGFLTISEVALFLKLSRSKVYSLMDSSELAYARFGRSRRVPKQALREFVEKSLVG
jgi:excisionase family DNA binding protein